MKNITITGQIVSIREQDNVCYATILHTDSEGRKTYAPITILNNKITSFIREALESKTNIIIKGTLSSYKDKLSIIVRTIRNKYIGNPINTVTVEGNLVKDSGRTEKISFNSVAVNEVYNDQKSTTYIKVVDFNARELGPKGAMISLTGRFRSDTNETPEGVYYNQEIVVDTFGTSTFFNV